MGICVSKAFLAIILVPAATGCAYLNGDALWLSAGQRKVALKRTFSTLGDVEYSFAEENLPFCFELTGSHEFGHIGHSFGVLDFSKGGLVKSDSVMHFSVHSQKAEEGIEFLVSNGIMRVVNESASVRRAERRTGPLPSDAVAMNGDERWKEPVEGKLVSICVWQYGCSVRMHRPGEYGRVYNYEFLVHDADPTRLLIYRIENLRWFHWSSL